MPADDYPEYCEVCGHEGCVCNTIVPVLRERLARLRILRNQYIRAANQGDSAQVGDCLAKIFDVILASEEDP